MDVPVVYADLNLPRASRPKNPSPPSLPQGACQCPPWHRLALKFGCAGIVLLVLSIIGWSVSVIFLIQKSSSNKSTVDVQQNRNETTERPALLKCPIPWHPLQDKCLFFPQASKSWTDSQSDCSTKESNLLLIQDQEELTLIQALLKNETNLFWIGLNYSLLEKIWKWINGSVLNSDILQITGEAKENSCVLISPTKVYSEDCDTDNHWICQKEPKPVRNKMCPDS